MSRDTEECPVCGEWLGATHRAQLAEARLAAVRNEILEGTSDGCDCDLGQPCPWHRIEGAILAIIKVG